MLAAAASSLASQERHSESDPPYPPPSLSLLQYAYERGIASQVLHSVVRPPDSRCTYRGVTARKGRFLARIRVRGQQRDIGRYDAELEAARAYDVASLRVRGRCAWGGGPGAADALSGSISKSL